MVIRSHRFVESRGFDLRRRQSRAQTDELRQRARFLDRGEQRLLADLFEAGLPCSTIAAELGRDPRTVRRQIRGITKRLLDPRFEFVTERAETWQPTRRRIAECLYVHGKCLRKTAQQVGTTLYNVRRHRDAIEAMFESSVHRGQ
ncbi:MAG: hypothetical protein AAFS11_01085 [Planctomycetota bacterium]